MLSWDDLVDWYLSPLWTKPAAQAAVPHSSSIALPLAGFVEINLFYFKEGFYIEDETFDKKILPFI